MKTGGVKPATATATATTVATQDISPLLLAEIDALKRELAILKAGGFGKGEKGDKGEKGEKGDPGPMTYIAMPQNMMAPAPVAAAAVAAAVLA